MLTSVELVVDFDVVPAVLSVTAFFPPIAIAFVVFAEVGEATVVVSTVSVGSVSASSKSSVES